MSRARSWTMTRIVGIVAAAAALFACGRDRPGAGIDGGATGSDATESDASAPDALIDAFVSTLKQRAYVKPSRSAQFMTFGYTVVMSTDGSTLAISGDGDDSAATGINGDQNNRDASEAGAVYVFVRSGASWAQQAYIKASNTDINDRFGTGLGISADGSTLAVGADGEASAASGIDGNQADNSAPGAGAVYVFTRSGATWSQQAYVKASNTDAGDRFGINLALSHDGATLVVGADSEASAATGINGDQTSNVPPGAGAVYVFTRSAATWSQQAYVKASNTGAFDGFGGYLALSADGATLAVAAVGEASTATGINGNQLDNLTQDAGAVYVFSRSGSTWSQQAYVKASNTSRLGDFGHGVALSADGSTLAIGADGDSSGATGVDGDQTGSAVPESGAVYLFRRTGLDLFGTSVALSGDGGTLVVGAPFEASFATGIDGDQTLNGSLENGAAYVFH
ncbi:MAG: hypothetical protein E6J91_21060 [Deltaproteobacteria bacterium]|nr:MAG: hypothetical protein E6J91_21060 [Deltaproteobacteria bacterium]